MSERKNLCVLVALHRWEGDLADQLGEDEARHASERCANRIERAISAQGGKLLHQEPGQTVAVFERSDAGVQAAADALERIRNLHRCAARANRCDWACTTASWMTPKRTLARRTERA